MFSCDLNSPQKAGIAKCLHNTFTIHHAGLNFLSILSLTKFLWSQHFLNALFLHFKKKIIQFSMTEGKHTMSHIDSLSFTSLSCSRSKLYTYKAEQA